MTNKMQLNFQLHDPTHFLANNAKHELQINIGLLLALFDVLFEVRNKHNVSQLSEKQSQF